MSKRSLSSIMRKVLMALSALFLMIFLVQHLAVNFASVISEEMYNEWSHFMGTNPLIQFVLQPVLMFGVAFHFIMGFVLEFQNRSARNIKYYKNKGSENSTWMSRTMIYSGLFILFFLGFHLYDFWIPEMNYKYVEANPEDPTRYYAEVQHAFSNIGRVVVYCLSFVFLSLHLRHGFQSSFQSIGANHAKYTPIIKKVGYWYAILIPVGYVYIAIFHYLNA